ncbi:cell envelope biogenesis protein TolA [Ralstonia solanacearum]|uniref:cell envelope biogenesis protein TolA n=1 Tax=Ralstonia solanacearum TaxID=305 RepID=UPI001BDEB366|nr:cell envelope biogenesis protein TolA [Ralstonia solanacearum]MBT1536524.1 cell envelope biogenesis protein TolA [Ralstonia solanacearum]
MARTPTAFTDDQLHAICLALQQLAATYPDNRAFLPRAFDQIDRIAGRSFGETVYRRLLEAAGIARTPSTRTLQAVLAARRAAPGEQAAANVATLRDEGLRAWLQRELRVALQDLVPPPAPQTPQARSAAAALAEADGAANAWLLQRCQQWEAENRDLRARAQQAAERASAAEASAAALQQQLATATAVAAARERQQVDQLGRVSAELLALAARLEGAERRRAVETDVMRQSLRDERSGLVARIEALERELATARTALDAYRRGAGGVPAARTR